MMLGTRILVVILAASVVAASPSHVRAKRQLSDDNTLQPIEDAEGDEQTREKRKLEGITQASFGIKNAVLGLVFGSGTTYHRRVRSPNTQAVESSSPTKVPLSGSVRQSRQSTDDIPVFDRNKVSLDFPGSLFGPSVSLLIKTTKIIGDVIQNSAVRYQTFLRLFQPLFKGPFEIKGLDPPTTTTTTKAPVAADNEVRRR